MMYNPEVAHLAGHLLGWLARRRVRYRVKGASMEPTLIEGDYLLVDTNRRPAIDDLALATHPQKPAIQVVKRVAGITDGNFDLRSDNPHEGTDSRTWGLINGDEIVGTVVVVLNRLDVTVASDQQPRGNSGPWRWLRR